LSEAALELIEEKGVEGFTLREAAAAIGVTHAAAYRHFEDKTALLAAIAERGFRDLAASLAAGITSNDSIGRVRDFACAYVAFALDRHAEYRVMFGPRLNETGRFPALEEAISQGITIVADEIKRGQIAGAIRAGRTRDIGLSIWVFSHGYVELVHHRRVKTKNRAIALEYFETLIDPLLQGLRA